jgi:hypothetical protein
MNMVYHYLPGEFWRSHSALLPFFSSRTIRMLTAVVLVIFNPTRLGYAVDESAARPESRIRSGSANQKPLSNLPDFSSDDPEWDSPFSLIAREFIPAGTYFRRGDRKVANRYTLMTRTKSTNRASPRYFHRYMDVFDHISTRPISPGESLRYSDFVRVMALTTPSTNEFSDGFAVAGLLSSPRVANVLRNAVTKSRLRVFFITTQSSSEKQIKCTIWFHSTKETPKEFSSAPAAILCVLEELAPGSREEYVVKKVGDLIVVH